jgi:hypothetical protein
VKNVQNIGVDLGRDAGKVSCSAHQYKIENKIAKAIERIYINNSLYSIDNIDIEIDGERFFVGKQADKTHAPSKPFSKNHISEYTKVMLVSALSILDDEQYNVMLGLPIADFHQQRKELIYTLKRDYNIKCGDKERRIIIKNISVFPQGLAGLLSHFLTFNGTYHRALPDIVGIVDIGYKDVNFAVLRDGEPDLSSSWSYPLGLHEAFKAALPFISKEYDYTIDEVKPEQVPKKYYDDLKKRYDNLLNKHWSKRNFPIYCCGGGSYWIKIGEQIDNPVFANAVGLRKLANMKWD